MNARKKPKQLVYNFKDRFAPAVEMGLKTSTIRLFAKTAPPVKGDRLKLYTGMRTKKCRKLREVICQDCCPIFITEDDIQLNGISRSPGEQNSLAFHDGFNNAAELRAFFRKTYGLPLPGKPHWVSWDVKK